MGNEAYTDTCRYCTDTYRYTQLYTHNYSTSILYIVIASSYPCVCVVIGLPESRLCFVCVSTCVQHLCVCVYCTTRSNCFQNSSTCDFFTLLRANNKCSVGGVPDIHNFLFVVFFLSRPLFVLQFNWLLYCVVLPPARSWNACFVSFIHPLLVMCSPLCW